MAKKQSQLTCEIMVEKHQLSHTINVDQKCQGWAKLGSGPRISFWHQYNTFIAYLLKRVALTPKNTTKRCSPLICFQSIISCHLFKTSSKVYDVIKKIIYLLIIQVDEEEETVIRNLRSVLRRLKKHAVTKSGKEFYGIERKRNLICMLKCIPIKLIWP